jgi:hypothetical protein
MSSTLDRETVMCCLFVAVLSKPGMQAGKPWGLQSGNCVGGGSD